MSAFWNSLLFVLLGALFGAISVWAFGSNDLFACNSKFTNICSYQTLLTGICAVIAAAITAYFIRKQIHENSSNHNKEIEIQNLQFQHDIHRKVFGVASSIAGEILALINRVEEANYVEAMKAQFEILKLDQDHKVSAFPVTSNYFIVFDNICTEVGLLRDPLPKEICYWYTKAKGFLDTVIGVNKNDYGNTDQIDLAFHLYNELKDLIDKGRILVEMLDGYADENKSLAISYRDKIDFITNS